MLSVMSELSPNQVVAYNLRRGRTGLRRWTQAETAERLEPYLGTRWSVAVYSAAERSVDGKRVREFTADDIDAFSRAFEVPISFFFVPPSADDTVGHPQATAEPSSATDVIARLFALDTPTKNRILEAIGPQPLDREPEIIGQLVDTFTELRDQVGMLQSQTRAYHEMAKDIRRAQHAERESLEPRQLEGETLRETAMRLMEEQSLREGEES